MTKSPFDSGDDILERRRMSGIRQSLKQGGTFLGGKIQLANTILGDVDGNDTGNLVTERLDRDYDR